MTPSQTRYGVNQALSSAVHRCNNGGSNISRAISTTIIVISVGRFSGIGSDIIVTIGYPVEGENVTESYDFVNVNIILPATHPFNSGI